MERYIGLDVHAQTCAMVVLGPSGRRLKDEIVETNARSLIEAMRRVSGSRHVCMEEGAQSAWLYEILTPHVDELAVVVPSRKNNSSKGDLQDAFNRADELRRGVIEKTVYKPPVSFAPLRAALQLHTVLAQDSTRIKNRLKAIFRSRGVLVDDSIYHPDSRRCAQLIAQLPPVFRPNVEALRAQLAALKKLQTPAEARLIAEARKHRAYEWIKSAPGIGPIRAATILAVVVTPHRFRTARQFWSYSGLALNTSATGEWGFENGRRIRRQMPLPRGLRQGHPLLKACFKGAVITIISMTHEPLRDHYGRLVAHGHRESLARLTLARKLEAIVLALWKNEEVYDPKKHTIHTE